MGLSTTYGVGVVGSGNVYIADTGNGAMRELTYAFAGQIQSQTITFGPLGDVTLAARGKSPKTSSKHVTYEMFQAS
jgi:hypothetical protein